MPFTAGQTPSCIDVGRVAPTLLTTGTYAPITRRLDCFAAFFADESDRNRAAKTLQAMHGIKESQVVLLRPGDRATGAFGRLSRPWTRRWPADGQSGAGEPLALAALALFLVVFLVVLLTVLTWALDPDLSSSILLMGGLLVVLVTGVAAAVAVETRAPKTHSLSFEANVQVQLTEGLWAVVVHHMPAERQADVVQMLRDISLRWCAVALPSPRL